MTTTMLTAHLVVALLFSLAGVAIFIHNIAKKNEIRAGVCIFAACISISYGKREDQLLWRFKEVMLC